METDTPVKRKVCLEKIEGGDRSPVMPLETFGRDHCPAEANTSSSATTAVVEGNGDGAVVVEKNGDGAVVVEEDGTIPSP